jgi:hypothetical protein
MIAVEGIPLKNATGRGAKLLDKILPGWAVKIRLADLLMGDPFGCVIGQLYGSYEFGILEMKNFLSWSPSSYGFCLPNDYEGSYAELTRWWTEEIEERKADPEIVRAVEATPQDLFDLSAFSAVPAGTEGPVGYYVAPTPRDELEGRTVAVTPVPGEWPS